MGYMVRKISRAKWDLKSGLSGDFISADAVTSDLRTSNNCLSLWFCNDPNENIELSSVVLALVATSERNRIDPIDVAWIHSKDLSECDISQKLSPGKTLVEDMINKHVDVIDLDLTKLCILAKIFAHSIRSHKRFKRYSKKEVRSLLSGAVKSGRLKLDKLKDEVQFELKPYLDNG